MKQWLKKIYHDFSNGKLTQNEALEEIKLLKMQDNQGYGTIHVSPTWTESKISEQVNPNGLGLNNTYIILIELPEVDTKQVENFVGKGNCLNLKNAADKNIAERYSSHATACFQQLQKILAAKPSDKTSVQIFVANNQEGSILSGLSALLKTATLENPLVEGKVILTDKSITTEELGVQSLNEVNNAGDTFVKYENGKRYVSNWKEIGEAVLDSNPKIAFNNNGVYLITGGLGGLGVVFAKEIIEQCPKAKIVLTGRSKLSKDKQALLNSLNDAKNSVSYQQVDVTNAKEIDSLVANILKEHKQLNGIIHSAGLNIDNFILKKSVDEFNTVLLPKVIGSYNLQQATKNIDLDFIVFFSSIASTMGNVGQADYAAANGFMDQFAAFQNEKNAADNCKTKLLSINWPLWKTGGMELDKASQDVMESTIGARPISELTGLLAFYRNLQLETSQVLVLEGNLAKVRSFLFDSKLPESKLISEIEAKNVEIEVEESSDNLVEKTKDYLRKEFSAMLKVPVHKIDAEADLENYGIDSVLAISLSNQLEKTFGPLSKTLFFEYKNIQELTEYFTTSHIQTLARIFNTNTTTKPKTESVNTIQTNATKVRNTGRRFSPKAQSVTSESVNSYNNEPIAIVGLSGRFPEALNIEEYWENLRDGKDCVTEIPEQRWDWRKFYSEDKTKTRTHSSKWGGFISGVDEFDPRFFNISPREAIKIDPQERLFLQHSWMAIEDAGYTRKKLQIPDENDLSGQIGVYAGVMYGEYNLSGSLASIANRVSYFLNLHGPSITMDTMCSSSLTTIHMACQDLKNGRTSLGIAGGVNITANPNKYTMLSEGQFISSDGHCQSFGEGGDGYIPGEGVGVVVLKRLSEAQRDGNHIYGVIKGSALNHGGKTNGYSVPNPQAQAAVINRALSEANIEANKVSYIEAHGTGTKLGDPIEIAALTKAFNKQNGKASNTELEPGSCIIGSAKSNVGHCESAAGIAGVAKVLLQMKHKKIVPSLHSQKLNPHINFDETPFVVNQHLIDWEQPIIDGKEVARIAGISSFGAGGSNAHIIIEEYQQEEAYSATSTSVIIPLSAKKPDQLKQKAIDLLGHIQKNKTELSSLTYTLQVGREAMDERIGFIASSIEELTKNLQAFCNEEQFIEGFSQGQAKRKDDTLSKFGTESNLKNSINEWIRDENFSKILDLWVRGVDIDWDLFYATDKPKLISLPTYPFAKEKYWQEVEEKTITSSNTKEIIHPLLQENTSNLVEQSYKSVFSGNEFFMSHNQVGAAEKILTGASYLEMARTAIAKSLPENDAEKTIEIQNIAWGRTLNVKKDTSVEIALLADNSNTINYEIFSTDIGEDQVLCQGTIVLSEKISSNNLNLNLLKGQMNSGELDANEVYGYLSANGLNYGSAFKGISKVYKGNDQILAGITLPKALETGKENFVLHPSIIDSALQSSALLNGNKTHIPNQPSLPVGISNLKILTPCVSEMYAWVRYQKNANVEGNNIKIDIDLFDKLGNVCVQIEGIKYPINQIKAINNKVEKLVKVEPVRVTTEPKEIPFAQPLNIIEETLTSTLSEVTFDDSEIEKSTDIALTSLDDSNINDSDVNENKVSISLDNISLENETISSVNVEPSIKLWDNGQGIFSINIENNSTLTAALASQLLQALNKAKSEASLKVLIIEGTEKAFLTGSREAYNTAVEQKLYHELVSFPYPVIASVEGEAKGAGFLFAALCDFMICSKSATFRYTNSTEQIYPSVAEYTLFKERFDEAQATNFLLQTTELNGEQLKEKGWEITVVASNDVSKETQALATNLANKPQEALSLLKQHLSQKLISKVDLLAKVEQQQPDSAKGKKVEIKTTSEFIHIETPELGVLHIDFSADKGQRGIKNLVKDLPQVFAQAEKSSQIKTVVLSSKHTEFIPSTAATKDVLSLQNLILESTIPVVAVLGSKANGKAWLISQFCDACIYSANEIYSTNGLTKDEELGRLASMIFPYKLGKYAGKEVVLTGKEYSTTELQEIVGTLQISEADKALATAVELAKNWASLPKENVVSIKQAKSSAIKIKLQELPVWSDLKEEKAETVNGKIETIALKSNVVSAKAHTEGIVEIEMADKEAKNTFSEALLEGMNEVFAHINKNQNYKVVVLTGYDQYFASGGTKDTLVAIQEGKTKFTDNKIYQIALTCNLPVIAAMQGHGVGAGWALGMFADLTLYSSESKYFSPYMNYGFTPGAGATFVFTNKVGYDLAKETLLTAKEFSGTELKSKGLKLPVIPRAKIGEAALALAKQIANNSRTALIAMKKQMSQLQTESLEETYKQELEMHEKTFVGSADTLKQIQDNFNQESTAGNSQVIETETKSSSATNKNTLNEVIEAIKQLLANELMLGEDEIDLEAQFIDLGLDSITGVTWVRKINEKYNTEVEATQIYSFPTLNQLAVHIEEEARKVGSIVDEVEESTQQIPVINDQNVVTESEEFSSQENVIEGVTDSIKTMLAEELHMESDEIDLDTQFIDLGLDSITGVTWIRKINDKYKTEIEATEIYNYPTLTELSKVVKADAEKQGSLPKETVKVKVATPTFEVVNNPTTNKLVSIRNNSLLRKAASEIQSKETEPIAVIGLSGQFPKSNKLEDFWENISTGTNCISEIPKERWDTAKYFEEGSAKPGKTYSKWLGLLEDCDKFDPLFFNISPTEAENMDPQQRLFLQECWNTIEDAGYNPKSLSGSKCGVFVGVAAGDYHQLSKKDQLSAQGFTGAASSILAARIAYYLNLQGPCISIDTACSSSLVAIANACDSLNSGNSNVALAGGVCIMATPAMHIMCSQTGMLSSDGRCFTFDQRANGFVPGEGVGVVMLKRLSDAEKDGDIIHGVINGWGINQDGKTNGITAPNSKSQLSLEQEVYDKFKIDPEQIQLIEAHGTGTKLGDPIEVDALKQAFSKYTTNADYCAIGSVKSNIGHCLTAAGVASFIKTMLAIKNKQLPPTINYNSLNEHISLKNSPFYVNDKLQDWEVNDKEKRQAAISAFGFSGTNAHMVVSEYASPEKVKPAISVITQNDKIVVPLSAKTVEGLKLRVDNLLNFLQSNKAIDLKELAYTLQIGREEMDDRLCFLVSSVDELIGKLEAYSNDEQNIEGLYTGHAKQNKEGLSIITQDDDMKQTIVGKYIAERKLTKIVNLWVKGLEIDWNEFYGEEKPNRIALPTYPFAKQSYWLNEEEIVHVSTSGASKMEFGALLHNNISNLFGQCYSSTFERGNVLLSNHKVAGFKILPSILCLEMAYEAIIHGLSKEYETIKLVFNNLELDQPIYVEDKEDITISLSVYDDENLCIEVSNENLEEENAYLKCEARVEETEWTNIDIENIKSQFVETGIDIQDIFQDIDNYGLNYNEFFKCKGAFSSNDEQSLLKLELSDTAKLDSDKYILHPAIMESALLASKLFVSKFNPKEVINLHPNKINKVSVFAPISKEVYVWIQKSNNTLNLTICDTNGRICMEVSGIQFTSIKGHQILKSRVALNNIEYNQLWDQKSYSFNWEETSTEIANSNLNHKSVLIVCSDSMNNFESEIQTYYNQNGKAQVKLIKFADKTKQLSDNNWELDANDPKAIESIQHNIEKYDALYFLSINQLNAENLKLKDLTDSKQFNEIQLLRLVQYLKGNNKIEEKVDTFILTLDSYSLSNYAINPAGSGVIGLGYSLAQGLYQFKVRNIDLSSEDLKQSKSYTELIKRVTEQPASNRGELIKIHGNKVYRQAFNKLVWEEKNCSAIMQNGVYLIAGGSGTVGQIMTRNLIEKYDAKVIWLGRSSANAEKIVSVIQSFGSLQESISYYQADVTQETEINDALKIIKKKYGQINGAIFSGMVTEFEDSIDHIKEQDFNSSIEVKVQGTYSFYAALKDESLDFMCYFSSGQAYSFTGAAKCAGYASGIAFSDSLVQSIQQISKFPVGIINWGFWQKSVDQVAGVSTGSLASLEDTEGFECFERFLSDLKLNRLKQVLCMKTTPQVQNLMNCYPERFLISTDTEKEYELISNKKPESNNSVIERVVKEESKIAFEPKKKVNIDEHVSKILIDSLSSTLKISIEKIDRNYAFSDYGIDSILGVKFIDQINDKLNISLNTAILFEYASINKLNEHILKSYNDEIKVELEKNTPSISIENRQINKGVQPVAASGKAKNKSKQLKNRIVASNTKETKPQEIAIVGISGKFPKAENIEEYWDNIINGVDGIEELPPHYLDQKYFSSQKQKGKTRCKWGGILSERDCFDPLFFKISPKEAEAMNPHQRLVMQESWKALEDAGYNPKQLSDSSTGVIIGSEPTEYNCKTFTGYSDAIIASRLSYYLNLNGPAFVVNTGCSSSAVAIHLACESLRNKESDMVISGGVHACMDQNVQIRLDEIEMLSPTGRCHTFDDTGDGTIISEGVGIVVLKRLDEAIESGDQIYGIISGSGINQDGASNGITAPNGAAQEQLITNVYERYKIDAEKISYVEAHGTGTKLGDPVEANSLIRAFSKFSTKPNSCAIGSAKSNIGHTSSAAGVAGVIKVLMSLKHNSIPKLLHFNKMNSLINFSDSPFYIPTENSEWKKTGDSPRMAALNSFGHSGTNAHLVIKEYNPEQATINNNRNSYLPEEFIIPISAKNEEQLTELAGEYLNYIKQAEDKSKEGTKDFNLLSMAYTLQVGRESMDERFGFIVNSTKHLVDKLQAFLKGDQGIENLYQKSLEENKLNGNINIDQLLKDKNLPELLDLWVNGYEIDWSKLYAEEKPQRIHIPTYPFAKEKYWFDGEELTLDETFNGDLEDYNDNESIEEIINKIDLDSIDTNLAINLLNSAVN